MPKDEGRRRARRRPPLTRERVIDAAIRVADRDGLSGLTMRSLGDELGVAAMSLYKHVSDKDEVLTGMVEVVLGEIELPDEGMPWRDALRARAFSSLAVLRAHPWAISLLHSQPATPEVLGHHDRVFGVLRRGGFSPRATSIAFATLTSYVYGYVVQEQNFVFTTSEELHDAAQQVLDALPPDEYPYLSELTTEVIMQPGYTYADDFALGLEVVLDGLESLRAPARATTARKGGRRG